MGANAHIGVRTKLRWGLEYGLFSAVLTLLGALPYKVSINIGRLLGRAAFYLVAGRRRIALDNVTRVFSKSRDPEQCRSLAMASFENLGMLLADFAKLPGLSAGSAREIVEIEGLEHLESAKGFGKGVLCLGAHFGSFELMSYALALAGHPLAFIVRPLDNRYLDKAVRRIREGSGNRTIAKHNAVMETMREISRKGAVGILIDQHAARETGVLVEFMGRKAWTTTSPAAIALRTGAPVIPVMIERKPDRSAHVLRVGPPVELTMTNDRKRDIEVNTLRFNRVLEEWIARRPELWLWCHRRWR